MIYYAAFVILTAIMAWLAATETRGWKRFVVVGIFGLLCIGAPLVYFNLLSQPKDVTDEIRRDTEVEVAAYFAVPGEALYLLLHLPGIGEPRYYFMEWSEEAEKLTQQLQDGQEAEQQMMIPHPFERSLEHERQAYPKPPEKGPEKQEHQAPDYHRL